MNTKFNTFQIVVLGIFVLFIIIGVVAFAFYKGNSAADSTLPAITVWGTFSKSTFDQYVANISNHSTKQLSVTYVEKSLSQFSQDFIAALARGQGPDAILIPAELLLPHEDKLVTIPFSSISQRDFLDTYIQEADIYINKNGIVGFPFLVDPLVMYWNRDMFDAAGIATYPRYWDDFADINKSLTVKDANGNIRKSAIALGQFGNITNAREIFGTILLQSGNPVSKQSSEGVVSNTISSSYTVSPEAAIKFFTKFANPSNENYSWNKSMAESKAAFLAGTLATYFGFASELADLRAKNPNINFDVALMPRPKTGGSGATYGRLYGFSMVRTSANTNTAITVISMLSASQYLSELSGSLYLPNVRRDVIAAGSSDPYITLFNKAALVSATWLDADPWKTGQIFSNMIESFSSGQKDIFRAIQDASDQFNVLLNQAISQ